MIDFSFYTPWCRDLDLDFLKEMRFNASSGQNISETPRYNYECTTKTLFLYSLQQEFSRLRVYSFSLNCAMTFASKRIKKFRKCKLFFLSDMKKKNFFTIKLTINSACNLTKNMKFWKAKTRFRKEPFDCQETKSANFLSGPVVIILLFWSCLFKNGSRDLLEVNSL